MVWVDEWRGDRVRSRLCVRQFKAEGLRDDLIAGTPDTFSSSICWQKQRVARISESLSSTFLLHSCTLEQMRKSTWKCLQVSRVQNIGNSRQQWMERGKHQSTGESTQLTGWWQICFSSRMTSIRAVTKDFVMIWTWNSTVMIFWCVVWHEVWKNWQRNSVKKFWWIWNCKFETWTP